ncbi:MAG: hypothetical protein CM15mL9_340 [uncultured marine virus]|nr:MAG: hypothetical protein CM15mL9_340 [uncultured marine virus]
MLTKNQILDQLDKLKIDEVPQELINQEMMYYKWNER